MGLTASYKSDGYSSSTYSVWDVEIIGGSGGGHAVKLSEGGVRFNLLGEQRTPQSRWAPITATFEIIVDHSSIQAFVDDISSYSEESFFLRVYRNEELKFIGKLTGDGNEQEDNARPYYFKLQAADGMGMLSGRNYADDSDAPYHGDDSIINIIYKCLSKIQTNSLFGSEIFLITLHDNVEDSQEVDGDPFKTQKIDQSIFYEKGRDIDTYNYRTCEEVLRAILVAYDLCLRYVGPHYLLYKLKSLASADTGYKYDSGGGYLGTISYGHSITINNDDLLDAERKGISSFGTMPPLEKVRITYDHGPQNTNLLLNVSFSGNNLEPEGATILEVGTIDVPLTLPDGLVNLKFTGKLTTNSIFYGGSNPPRWKNHRFQFRLYLRAKRGVLDRYWKRELDAFDFYNTVFSNFTPSEFYEGFAYYDIVTDIIDERARDIDLLFGVEFDTTLLAIGINTIYFGFELIDVFDENLHSLVSTDNPIRCDWIFHDLILEALQEKKVLNINTKTVYEAIGNVANSDVVQETTIIGDGPQKTSNSRIKVKVGGEYKDAKAWGGKHLLEKSAADILASRSEALHLLLGGFYARTAWMDSLITYQGRTYNALSVQYITQYEEWTGEWYEMKSASHTITRKKKIILKKERIPQVPTRLPDDEKLEDRILRIITGDTAYTFRDTDTTSIELRDPAKHDLWRVGDIINIIDPVIGYTDELTVTADVHKDDTSISIAAWTPIHDFPPHSYLELNYQYQQSIIGGSSTRKYWQIDEDFSGTVWPITVASLPDPTTWASDKRRGEISKRITLNKNGQILIYLLDIDNGTRYEKGYQLDGNNIVFLEPCDHNVVQIIFEK